MKNTTYRISVLSWSKYNSNLKKGHNRVMLSMGFLSDAKIRKLSPTSKLLFLSCILVAGESFRSQSEVDSKLPPGHFDVSHESLVFQSGVKSGSLQSQLSLLQSLQLVRYEILDDPYEPNRKERNKNKKGKEVPKGAETAKKPPDPEPEFKLESPPESKTEKQRAAAPPAPGTGNVIAAYCDAWKERYRAPRSPPIPPQHAKNLKAIVEQVGVEQATKLVKAYLQMPDSWYVTKRHDLGTFLANLNAVTHYAETGRMISKRETQQLDAEVTNQNTLDAIRRGEV